MLLGMDWLKVHNLSIDWAKNKIHLDCCLAICQSRNTPGPTISYLLPTCEWEVQVNNYLDLSMESIDTTHYVMAHIEKQMPEIAQTIVSTTLAIQVPKMEAEVPLAFAKYQRVFSDEQAQRLPKNQPWDHRIKLIPNQTMGKTSVY